MYVYHEKRARGQELVSKAKSRPKIRSSNLSSSYWRLLDVIDEALQRLYWACREKSDFPGQIPNESIGKVTTHSILDGLGLIGPELDEAGFPEVLKQASPSVEKANPT